MGSAAAWMHGVDGEARRLGFSVNRSDAGWRRGGRGGEQGPTASEREMRLGGLSSLGLSGCGWTDQRRRQRAWVRLEVGQELTAAS